MFTYGSVLMSRTSSNGCTDSGDLAGRLAATDVICSVHGTLPIIIRHKLHIKRGEKKKQSMDQRQKTLLSEPRICCFLLNGTNIQDLGI